MGKVEWNINQMRVQNHTQTTLLMYILPEVSAEITTLLCEHEQEVKKWFSRQVYGALVAENKDSLLVRVGKRVEWKALEKECQEYRHYAGKRGQAESYGVGQLLRLLLVRYLLNCSLRESVALVRRDILVRWFCGFDLLEATPSFATLQRFECWMMAQKPRLLFDKALDQIDKDFPADANSAQIGDTFALRSLTADLTLTQLLRRTASRWWEEYLVLLPAGAEAPATAETLYTQLQGGAEELPEYRLDGKERDVRAVACAQFLTELLPAVQSHIKGLSSLTPEQKAPFDTWQQRLEKILADEFVRQPGEDGQPPALRRASKEERGSYRILTPVDPDITLRVHDDTVDRGYNISLAATPDFVREIAAATGATPDSAGVEKLIEQQKIHRGVVPPKLIYDQAAGTPKKIADVAKASDGKTQLVVRLVDYSRNRVRFGPLDFSLGEDGVLTCPNGQTSVRAYRSNSADGWNYRFLAEQCAGCPLADKCRGDAVKAGSYRQVFISRYQSQQRSAIAYMKTDAFQADMQLRPHIERIIACLVRHNGARETQGFGLARADFQVKMAATAYNLKHWLVLLLERERAQRVQAASP